jgi:hypothetical protein
MIENREFDPTLSAIYTIWYAKLRSSTILNSAVERLSGRVGDLLDRSHAIGFLRLLAGAVEPLIASVER